MLLELGDERLGRQRRARRRTLRGGGLSVSQPQIEVLTFAGCPHTQPALELVERIVDELALEASVRHVDVSDLEQAEAHRFLGSPSIRVNGRDIEPGRASATTTDSPAGSTEPRPA